MAIKAGFGSGGLLDVSHFLKKKSNDIMESRTRAMIQDDSMRPKTVSAIAAIAVAATQTKVSRII